MNQNTERVSSEFTFPKSEFPFRHISIRLKNINREDMMSKSMENKKVSLLRSVEERSLTKKKEQERRKQHETDLVPYIPKDCVSNILVRLPLDALQRSRFVCKTWYDIINSAAFIDAHHHRSETVLVFLSSIPKKLSDSWSVPILPENPNAFSVETKLHFPNSPIIFDTRLVNRASQSCIRFLELKDGKCQIGGYNISCLGNIRATCNGLLLLDDVMKKGRLVIMNPVTRKLMPLPLGTLSSQFDESYGFALRAVAGEYKVVHLFRDYLAYLSCEILDIGTRSWRAVDGPSSGLLQRFRYGPVFAISALHWTPEIDHGDHIVSMDVESERFRQIALPTNRGTYDLIVEMSGDLGFVTHNDEFNHIDVWILKSLLGVWTKHHSIMTGCILDMTPLCCLRIKGELVFKRDEDGSIYVYNFQFHEMTRVEMMNECIPFRGSYLPHVNNLVSW